MTELPVPIDDLLGLPLQKALDMLAGELQEVIRQAEQAGQRLAVEAGRQAQFTIESLRNAYRDSLDRTVREILDKRLMPALADTRSVILQVQKDAFKSIDEAMAALQMIANSLPFHKQQPQLLRCVPLYVVAQQHPSGDIQLVFTGNFESAGQPNLAPSLECGHRTYPLSANTVRELTFLVPAAELLADHLQAQGPVASLGANIPLLLRVPWIEKRNIFQRVRHEDTYRVLVGILPSSPGRLLLRRSWTDDEPEYGEASTGEIVQSSEAERCHISRDYDLHPDPGGWELIPQESQAKVGQARVDPFHIEKTISKSDLVRYNVQTFFIPQPSNPFKWGTSVHVYFVCREKRRITHSDERVLEVGWGDRKKLEIPPGGTFALVFDAFDHRHYEFGGVAVDNPFVSILHEDSDYVLKVADPDTLRWP